MSDKRQHSIRLEKRLIDSRDWHLAVCSCGWVSSFYHSQRKADEAGEDHLLYISMSGCE